MLGRHDRLLRRGDYIWGSFIKPERVDGYVVGVNPGDRSDVLGRFCFSETSVDDAVCSAVRGATVWRQGNLAQRAASLRRYREALHRSQEHFAILITRETGKPYWESRQEVLTAMRAVDLLLEDGLDLLAPRVLDEVEARSDHRPRGVVAVLAPYAMPLLIPTLHCAAALLAGNTVILKPSKFTPGVGQGIAELMDRCRLPRGAFNLVQGSGAGVGHRLASHEGLDALLFSGSFTSAMAIRRATFGRPELPTLFQCGGKGCAVVLEDCELDRTVYELLVGAFLTSGQRHNSTGRLIVTRPVAGRLLAQLVQRARAVRVGYGFDEDVFLGPLVSESFRTRYTRFGRTLLARGHTPLLDPEAREVPGRRGFYVGPAIYRVDWRGGTAFLDEEPPGPSLLVYEVDDWREAVQLHNRLAYRLNTSLFVGDKHPYRRDVVSHLKTGSLNINRGTLGSSLRLPAVGLGRSSNGIPSGIEILRFLSSPRATLVESRPFDASQLVPGVRWTAGDEVKDVTGELVPDDA